MFARGHLGQSLLSGAWLIRWTFVVAAIAWLGACDLTMVPVPQQASAGDGDTASQVDNDPTDNQVLASTVTLPLTHPRAAPSHLAATPAAAGGVELAWTDNAADEDGFLVQRYTQATGWVDLADVGANTASYFDQDTSADASYCYRVLAFNTTTQTSPSDAVCVTAAGNSPTTGPATDDSVPPVTRPAAPEGLTATVVANHVELTWQDHSSNESGFTIQRRVGTEGWVDYAAIQAGATRFTDQNVQPGTSYCYRVSASNSTGVSDATAEVCASLPELPTGGGGGSGVPDTDSDGDGTPDSDDLCPNDPAKTEPGACGCGVADIDSDGDGTPDCLDECPHDPAKTSAGICGCGVPDTDSDGDGTPDCNDLCPNDPAKTAPGQSGCSGAPTLQSKSPEHDTYVQSLSQTQVTFNEQVYNVAAGNLKVNGTAAGTLSGPTYGPGPYTFSNYGTVPDGTVSVALLPGAIRNDENLGFTEVDWTFTKDGTPPTGVGLTFGTVTTTSIQITGSGTDATAGIDAGSGYKFSRTGASDSGWTSNSYTWSGLGANTQYAGFVVTVRDRALNTAASTAQSKYTAQITPTAAPTFSNVTAAGMRVSTTGPVNLTADQSGVIFHNGTSDRTKVTNLYDDVTGLTANTQYTFKAKGVNGNGLATAYSGTASVYTLQNAATAPTFSNIGTTGMTLTTTGPTNLSAGSSGVIFKRNGTTDLAKVQALSTNDSSLTPNTLYSYTARGVNYAGTETSQSSSASKYTLAKTCISTDGTGSTGNVWCTNASTNTWYGVGKTFTFSNPAGFGTSTHGGSVWKASSFQYKWNQSATETWGTAGTAWSAGTINLTPAETDNYLHVRAINYDGTPNNTDVADYGPFKFDGTTPTVSVTVPANGAEVATSITSVSVTFSESVTSMAQGNLTVTGATVTGISGSGAGPYVFTLNPGPPDGDVTITLASGSTVDRAGNGFAGAQWTCHKDTGGATPHCPVACPSTRPARAFPSAEGFGALAKGGRGGRVLKVTNLDDYNPDTEPVIPGSLRWALQNQSGPRIIVFSVGGTILLKADLRLEHGEDSSFVTIAGQTAPGDGIQLGQWGLWLVDGVHDIVVRHLRIRPTITRLLRDGTNEDILKKAVLIGHNRKLDALNHDIIFDHCSLEWGMDDSLDVASCRRVTIQWCIIGEGSKYGDWLPAGTWDGDPTWRRYGEQSQGGCATRCLDAAGNPLTFDDSLTVHHCLFIHNAARNMMIYTQGCVMEFVNNLIYNWSMGTIVTQYYGVTESTRLNFIGNVSIHGPSGGGQERPLALHEQTDYPDTESAAPTEHCMYVEDNLDDRWRPDASRPEWDIAAWVHWPGYYGTDGPIPDGLARIYLYNQLPEIYRATLPFQGSSISVTRCPASDLEDVLATGTGAAVPKRDSVDARLIRELKARTGVFGIGADQQPPHWAADGSVISTGHDPLPVLASAAPPVDTDGDGMPDEWEIAQGLNPNDPADAAEDPDGDGYTNIEEYLNSLAGDE